MTIDEKIRTAYEVEKAEIELQFLQSKGYASEGTATLEDYESFASQFPNIPNPIEKAEAKYNMAGDKNKTLVQLHLRFKNEVPSYVPYPSSYRAAADKEFITLDNYKTYHIQNFVTVAGEKYFELIPVFNSFIASFENPEVSGEFVLSEPTRIKYYKTLKDFNTEFLRLRTAINNAVDLDGVDTAVASANFPTAIVG